MSDARAIIDPDTNPALRAYLGMPQRYVYPGAMIDQIETGECERGPDFALSPARAIEPVPVDHGHVAAGQLGEGTLPAGEDSAAMEHERQRRLHLWQEQR